MSYIRTLIATSLLAIASAAWAQAAKPDGNEIVRIMESKLFSNGKSKMTLTFVDEKNEKTTYVMLTFARDRNQRIIVRTIAPANMVGQDLLLLERNVWLYDAKTDRVMKIPSNQSFGGTGFSYGDVIRLNYADNYGAKVLSERPSGGWTVELSAKERDAPYFRIVMDIDADYRPVKGVFYGRSGDIVKEMVFSNVKDAGAGVKPLTITVTSPLEPGRTSTLTIDREMKKEYPEQVFNKRNLSARLEETL